MARCQLGVRCLRASYSELALDEESDDDELSDCALSSELRYTDVCFLESCLCREQAETGPGRHLPLQ